MTHFTRRSALTLLAGGLLVIGSSACAKAIVQRQQFIYVLRVMPKFQDPREWTEREKAVVGQHFEHLSKAAAQGQVILVGRTTEPLAITFGVVIFEATNLEAARHFIESDPAIAAGVMTATLHPYAVALHRAQRIE